MFILELAKIKIKINNRYPYLERQCTDYIVDSTDYDFEVFVTDDELDQERKQAEKNFSDGYIESISMYRKICVQLPSYNCILMHSAVIKVNEKAFGFCAKSGTGKTTHTKLWKQLLGDEMSYVNGDKPLIRIIDNIPYAFGTPWNGKENYGANTFAKLHAIAFIERSLTNSITPLNKNEILPRIIHQILLPKDEKNLSLTFDTLNSILNKINIYLLKCNMELEAAKIAYNQMIK